MRRNSLPFATHPLTVSEYVYAKGPLIDIGSRCLHNVIVKTLKEEDLAAL